MLKKETILFVAIALTFVFFVGYGIEVFSASPQYNNFCSDKYYELDSQEACEEDGGSWRIDHCNPPKECQEQFDIAQNKHDQVVFIISTIVGLIAILVGIILKKKVVGTGLLGGGVILIIYGTLRYWQHANDLLKFIILGAALATLIWIGYKKLR